jgi:hypothetical protein
MAAITIAVLGMVFVATSSSQPRLAQTAERAAATPEAALETWYVPAQHVNAAQRGDPIQETVQEFY